MIKKYKKCENIIQEKKSIGVLLTPKNNWSGTHSKYLVPDLEKTQIPSLKSEKSSLESYMLEADIEEQCSK